MARAEGKLRLDAVRARKTEITLESMKYEILWSYAYAMGMNGMVMAAMGPALLELSARSKITTLGVIGAIYSARAGGMALSSLATGALMSNNTLNPHGNHIIALSMVILASSTVVMPFVNNVWALACVAIAQGLGMGVIDTCCNILTIWLIRSVINFENHDPDTPHEANLQSVYDLKDLETPREVSLAGSGFMASELPSESNAAAIIKPSFRAGKVEEMKKATIGEKDEEEVEPQGHERDTAKPKMGTGMDSYFQAMHFAFACGALLSPIIVGAFLQNHTIADPLAAAYLVVGGLTVVSIFAFIYLPSPPPPRNTNAKEEVQKALELDDMIIEELKEDDDIGKDDDETEDENMRVVNINEERKARSNQEDRNRKKQFRRRAIITVMTIFSFLVIGSMMTVGGYIYAFIIKSNIGGSKIATAVNTSFWFFVAIGRLSAIFTSSIVSPRTIMILNTVLGIIASAISLVDKTSLPLLWIGMSLYGLSVSSSFPTAFTLTDQYIGVDPIATSSFILGADAGGILIPLGAGFILKSSGVDAVLWILAGVTVCMVVALSSLIFLGEFSEGSESFQSRGSDVQSRAQGRYGMVHGMSVSKAIMSFR
ncbi:hypothetical protein AAMO2058_000742700 [Amorphochlora amoebiformis]